MYKWPPRKKHNFTENILFPQLVTNFMGVRFMIVKKKKSHYISK